MDCSHSVCLSVSPPRFSQQLDRHVSLPHSPTAYPILQASYPEPFRELEAPVGHAGEYSHLPTKPPTGQTQTQGKTGRHRDKARPADTARHKARPSDEGSHRHSDTTDRQSTTTQGQDAQPDTHRETQHNTTQRARQQQRQPSSAQRRRRGYTRPPFFCFFCALVPSPLLLDLFLSTHGGVWAE